MIVRFLLAPRARWHAVSRSSAFDATAFLRYPGLAPAGACRSEAASHWRSGTQPNARVSQVPGYNTILRRGFVPHILRATRRKSRTLLDWPGSIGGTPTCHVATSIRRTQCGQRIAQQRAAVGEGSQTLQNKCDTFGEGEPACRLCVLRSRRMVERHCDATLAQEGTRDAKRYADTCQKKRYQNCPEQLTRSRP